MTENLPAITENDIRLLANSQSFERGVNYYHSGALFNTRCVGNELRGHCHGSEYTPYRISVGLGSHGIEDVHCSCPYDWGGICKHLVALLLAWIHTPDVFKSVAPTDERLAGKSKEELIVLIQEMLKREPDLERLLDLSLQPNADTPFDLKPYRQQLDFILQNEFPDPAEVAFEIGAIAETADRFASGGNWAAAGAVFHLILSEIIPSYDQLYDEAGDISSVLQDCAKGLEHCLTESVPDPADRQLWFDILLEAEFMDIQMGGVDLAYPAREILIEHTTEEEWIQIEKRVKEKITLMNDQYSRWGRESLVNILAQRLMRTGGETVVSDLIFELGSAEQQAFELLRLGRLDEAISIAKEHFINLPGLVLQFATALVEAGGITEAVAYITSQLETRSRVHYFSWLAQSAEKQQEPEIALKWQSSLFHESPNLENYVTLRAVAQRLNRWISLRPELIKKLESDQLWDLLIVIALEEGQVNRAIELLPHQRWARHDLQVAEAAEADHPHAALKIYCKEIDRLIEARGRGNYQEAAAILHRIKKLYHQQNDHSKWDYFFMELRQRNARLPALMDELNKAGL